MAVRRKRRGSGRRRGGGSSARLRELLRERFGHADFRGRQLEAVEAVMEGRDVLLMAPTGSRKSIVYQLPAVALDGLVLVVSPLIALMKDQVDALQAQGIAAALVNSSIPVKQQDKNIQAAIDGELDLLYIKPERFRTAKFQAIQDKLPVVRLAIDEAHCISQWGHDFRPDYQKLGLYRASAWATLRRSR